MSTTNNTQNFTPTTTTSTATPPPPTTTTTATPSASPPRRNYARRALDGTMWALGGAAHGIKSMAKAPFVPIGSGIVSGAQHEFEQMVQPGSPLVAQLQDSLRKALLRQPPEELLQLQNLIEAVTERPESLTAEEIKLTRSYLILLLKDNGKLLNDLAPDLRPEDRTIINKIGNLFKVTDPNANFDLSLFETDVENLKKFDEVFTTILDRSHGTLVEAMAYLQEALLEEENGMLAQAVDVLKKKCTDEQTGLMKQVVDQLTLLLGKKDGPIDLLTNKLTVGEESTIAKAIALIQAKMLDKDGIVDQIGNRFNHEEEGIVVKALAITKTKMEELLKSSLVQFKEELNSKDGVMATLRQQLSEGENSVLKQAIALLNESLFKPDDGTMAKLRRELTSEDKGILQEALKIFAHKLNDEKEGVLVQTMDLLKKKLNADDGALAEAVRLLEAKLNGKDGVIDKLQHRLLNEHDGALIQALNHVQKRLNDEKEGILAKAITQMEQRLFAEKGTLDQLEKRLTADETGILAKAVESLKKALEKKDGPMDFLNARVQQMLADSLEILKKKCLDEKDGLIAQTLESLTKQLKAENGVLDTLNQRLNDPKDGIIVKAVASLNTKLTEENGTLDILQKKLLDEKEGILVKAIETLQKRVIDKDGLIDQVINQFQERLTHPEKGILVQAKQYLLDEKTGLFAQANALIKKKLTEKDGVLDLIESRLTHEETGILIKAAGLLEKKMMAMVDQIGDKLTAQAHPLLSNARKKLIELRKAISENNKAAIKKTSRALQEQLQLMAAQKAIVFAKQPLTEDDRLLLNQLTDRLPAFYAENPPSQGDMLVIVEAGLAAVNRYYISQEGYAARTGTILQEALDPVMSRLENLPKTMYDNFRGRTPTEPGDAAPAEEGTVSQFLANGSSILKTILDKGAQAISGQAISSFASVLILGINQVLAKMDNTETFRQPKTALEEIIFTLNSVQQTGRWGDLYQILGNAAQAMRAVKIYVNGFRIPNTSPVGNPAATSEAAYSDNINALQDAMDLAPEQPVNQDWRKLAGDEKNKLIGNASRYLTIKHIYQDICKLRPSDEVFYLTLMKKAKEKNGKTDEVLRDLLFSNTLPMLT